MRISYIANTIYYLLLSILIVSIPLCLHIHFRLQTINYNKLISLIGQKYPNVYLANRFGDFLTFDSYSKLKSGILAILFIQVLTALVLFYKRSQLLDTIQKLITESHILFKGVLLPYRSLQTAERLLIGALALGTVLTRVLLLKTYPFNGDEAESYFCFVNNGFLFTLCYYPEPNNHVLFNLICIVFDYFLDDPLLVMRLPNVLINFVLLLLLFSIVLKERGFIQAMLCTILCAFAFSTCIYSVHGRGYILLSLWSILSIYSCLKLNARSHSRIYPVLFVGSTTLGFFTIPIFITIALGLGVYMCVFVLPYNRVLIIKYSKLFFVISILTLLLYLPLLLVSGTVALTEEGFVPTYNPSHYFGHMLPIFFAEAMDYISGFYSKGYLFFMAYVLLCLWAYLKLDSTVKELLKLLLSIFIATSSLIIYKRTNAEPRFFTHLSFIVFSTLGIIMGDILSKYLTLRNLKYWIITLYMAFMLSLIPLTYDRKMTIFLEPDYLNKYSILHAETLKVYEIHPKSIYSNHKGFIFTAQYLNKTQEPYIPLVLIAPEDPKVDCIVLEQNAEVPTWVNSNNFVVIKNNFNAIVLLKKDLYKK